MSNKSVPTVQEVIERYKKNMAIWRVAARNDFEIMSQGEGLLDIREEYYRGWTNEHFSQVISEMKKNGG